MTQKNVPDIEPIVARDAPYYRAPAELRERVRVSLAKEASKHQEHRWFRGAALAASFVLVAVTSWTAALWNARSSDDAGAIDEAVNAHVRSLVSGNRLIDVESSDQHTVKPWFIGKVDLAPPVTDFAAQGFALAGGRLDYLDGRPAAALVYRHNAHVVNIFIASAGNAADSAPSVSTRKGYAVARWKQGGLAFEAVGDISAPDMAQLVQLMSKG